MKTPETQIRVRGIAELIAVLPHQWGYQPRQSLVVVLLGVPKSEGGPAAGSILMSMRVDIPPPEATEEVVRGIREVCAREAPFGVQLIAFTDTREDAAGLHALQQLALAIAEDGIGVDVVAQATGGMWCRRNPLGHPQAPPSWARVPQAADVPAAAELVLRGACPMEDREALERALDADHPLTHQAVLNELCVPVGAGGDSGVFDVLDMDEDEPYRVWGDILRTSGQVVPVADLSATDLAVAALTVRDLILRDAVLARVAPQQFSDLASCAKDPVTAACCYETEAALAAAIGPDPLDPDRLTDRLVGLCARTPRSFAAPALTLLGVHAWARGKGTLANLAIERALEVEPDYRMALLLDQVLVAVVRPRDFAGRSGAPTVKGRPTDPTHGAGQDPDAA